MFRLHPFFQLCQLFFIASLCVPWLTRLPISRMFLPSFLLTRILLIFKSPFPVSFPQGDSPHLTTFWGNLSCPGPSQRLNRLSWVLSPYYSRLKGLWRAEACPVPCVPIPGTAPTLRRRSSCASSQPWQCLFFFSISFGKPLIVVTDGGPSF